MSGTSNKTTLVTIRLPNEVFNLAQQSALGIPRGAKHGIYRTVSTYLRDVIIDYYFKGQSWQEILNKREDKKRQKQELKDTVYRLLRQGLSCRAIVRELTKQGIKTNKTTVRNWQKAKIKERNN